MKDHGKTQGPSPLKRLGMTPFLSQSQPRKGLDLATGFKIVKWL